MWTALLEEGLLLAGEGDRGSEAMGNDPARSLVGGDEVVLWCCLWSVDGERAGSGGCGQKLPLLEVGCRREGWEEAAKGTPAGKVRMASPKLVVEGIGCCCVTWWRPALMEAEGEEDAAEGKPSVLTGGFFRVVK